MMSRRMFTEAVAALAISIAIAGCSDRSDSSMNPVDGDGTPTVTISNFAFAPARITIDRGATVRWRNGTSTFHTVTPDGHTAFEEWETNAQGQTFEARFDQPGEYRYYCTPHRSLGMTGIIEVR